MEEDRKSTGIKAVDEEIDRLDDLILGPKVVDKPIIINSPVLTKDEQAIFDGTPGVITGATPESTKLKKKMLTKKIKEDKVPEHIRKVSITINDKKPNDPISVIFAGDWSESDLNLAGKHLILEYNLFVRNRAIRK